MVAKAGATFRSAAGGRFTLAVGVDYSPGEFAALEVDFDERGALVEEALQVIRAVWTGDDVGFEGRHFTAAGITRASWPTSPPADLDRRATTAAALLAVRRAR